MSDITSMSWSLAEGIVRRDIRNLRKKMRRVSDIYVAMTTQCPKMSGSKRIKYFEALLDDFQGHWVSGGKYCKKHRFNYSLWGLNDNGGLDRIDFKLKKHGVEIDVVAFGVSFHALARIVYRRNLSSIADTMCELNSHLEMHSLLVSQVINSGNDRNFRTPHGFFIMKLFDDGCVRAVTWVDEAKGSKVQLGSNSNLYSTICGLAESRGMTVIEYLKHCIVETDMGEYKAFRNAYVKQGGDINNVTAQAKYYEQRIIDLTKEVSQLEEMNYA